MTKQQLEEFALNQAAAMRVKASEAKQLGLSALAAFLRKNADDAMRWASNQKARAAK